MRTDGHFTAAEAAEIGHRLGLDWTAFDVDQFRRGMDAELEHGRVVAATNVTDDDPLLTGKIALAHLSGFPDYYDRLGKMEKEADAYWKGGLASAGTHAPERVGSRCPSAP